MKPLYSTLILAVGLAGCADHFDTSDFDSEVQKPASIAEFEYLKAYAPLKEYIDRNAHPGFQLGTGVLVSDYLKRGAVYTLTNTNFDQVTAGNAMKYASIVGDDGSMNFSNVVDFVDAATANGLSVYGHTLCWHSQQNVKWLNSLIADKKLEFDPNDVQEVEVAKADYSTMTEFPYWGQFPDGCTVTINQEEGCLEINNPAAVDFWTLQFMGADNFSLAEGENYTLKVMARATGDGAFQGNIGSWGTNVGLRLGFSTEWEELTYDFVSATSEGAHVLMQCGDFVGTVQIKYVAIYHKEAPAGKIPVSIITNGDLSGTDYSCFYGKENQGNPHQSDVDPVENAYVVHMTPRAAEDWDNQFFIKADRNLEVGTEYTFRMKVKSAVPRTVGIQAHKGNPGDYIHWSFAGGSFTATTDWTEYEYTGTVDASSDGVNIIAMNLNSEAAPEGGDIWFKDVEWTIMIESNFMPLTPEEKNEILTAEMERWIKGMMNATEGKVKAWDVVNEAISGGPWGQKYDLQHGSADTPNDFFWQDYLGDNFVRVPVKFARQYFEEAGGNPAELKLFINDYNLESDWDQNQKLKSLIQWIEQWESDGETVIDGIGTQMHISYYENTSTQQSKEAAIENMFKLMAQTGKLVRITELDMGYVDASGNSLKTEQLTVEQHKAMAEHYKWIVKKYFELIPTAQQYGICHWAQTDSPAGSGWRAEEPIGLWDLNLSRKPAYAGMAEGLAEKE